MPSKFCGKILRENFRIILKIVLEVYGDFEYIGFNSGFVY
jgi:hypothetical protein